MQDKPITTYIKRQTHELYLIVATGNYHPADLAAEHDRISVDGAIDEQVRHIMTRYRYANSEYNAAFDRAYSIFALNH